MAETVSKIAAFVFENGAMAQQILFRDLDNEGELPGLTPEDRQAMSAVVPELRDTWVSLLTACRVALWRRASGHATDAILQKGKTQDGKMWQKREVRMPLLPGGAAECWISLGLEGTSTKYQLHAGVWIKPVYRPVAAAAMSSLTPAPRQDSSGSYLKSLVTPQEGDSIESLAEQAAEALWSMAKPVAEAVVAAQNGKAA
jgi:hypothetical protein